MLLDFFNKLSFWHKRKSFLSKVKQLDDQIFILSEEKKGLEGLRADHIFSDSMISEMDVYLKDKEFKLIQEVKALEKEMNTFI